MSFGSVLGHGYTYCGKHWKLDHLPINFRVNETGMRLSRADFEDGTTAAAEEWDSAAPLYGSGPRTNACSILARIICISRFSYSGGLTSTDGIDTILWTHQGALGPLAQAWITATGNVISDVDIELNLDVDWFWVTDDLAIGATTGAAAGALGGTGFCPQIVCAHKFDIQGVLAHEFGHALGLEHVTGQWPEDLTMAADYTLVMWEWMYDGSSLKRALGWGDILGLQRAMFYTASGQ